MFESIIINIKHKTYTLDNEEILKLVKSDKFKYRFIPVVAYNKKTSGKEDLSSPRIESFHKMNPFTLYELGTSITILKNYMGTAVKKEDLISAKKAFKELKQFASQCHERVIADLCTQIILREIEDMAENQHITFFIEKSASDKILGRLSSLCLNLERVSICFLVFEPSDLMTTVMSYQTGKLHFDIHRLMTGDISDLLGPYPGDSEDSLIQTYFYKPPSMSGGGEYRPMRLDLFTQGLLRDKIEEKKEGIRKILNPDSPDKESFGSDSEPRLLLPYGSHELEESLKKQETDIMDKLLMIGEK
ncbi:MAG: hypothetical protein AB1632_01600 [Nitrospirota bacterium]